MEGIHSPTSLLKLFTIWSQVPRYVWNILLLCTVWFKFNKREQKISKIIKSPFSIFKLLNEKNKHAKLDRNEMSVLK